jgi:hypothetical protein
MSNPACASSSDFRGVIRFLHGVRGFATGAIGKALVIFCFASSAQAAVTISTDVTQNMSCANGVCAPTAPDAVLNTGDLETLLASSAVTVTTTGSSVQASDIQVTSSFGLTSGNLLTLDAYQSIDVGAAISVKLKSGLSLVTDDGGSGGELSFENDGHIVIRNLSAKIHINGVKYTLVDKITALAAMIKDKPNGKYAFAVSYDASADGTYNQSPVSTALTGTVQGLGNTISNLSIDDQSLTSATALFSRVATSGAIENLRLSRVAIFAPKKKEPVDIGSLAGGNDGLLFGDEATGSVRFTHCALCVAGGLVGGNSPTGSIIRSSARVRVRGANSGGLVGANAGTISLSHADGIVQSKKGGGLVSANEGNIDQSFATGDVRGASSADVAGFVAQNDSSTATITNSYAIGTVIGAAGADVAGFIGQDTDEGAVVKLSYSTGALATGTGGSVGGFACAALADNVSDTYWDITSSGTSDGTCFGNISGITGLTTEELQAGLPSGFDPAIWAEDSNINNGLPYLINNPPSN